MLSFRSAAEEYAFVGKNNAGMGKMVRPRRFELLTYSFGGCRSIQLSYGRITLS